MAASWTAVSPALPTWFAVAGFESEPSENEIYLPTMSGRVSSWRISTNETDHLSAQFIMTLLQVRAFIPFRRDTLKGSLPFQNLVNPLTGVNTVWQPLAKPRYRPHGRGGTHFDVIWQLAALPDAPA